MIKSDLSAGLSEITTNKINELEKESSFLKKRSKKLFFNRI